MSIHSWIREMRLGVLGIPILELRMKYLRKIYLPCLDNQEYIETMLRMWAILDQKSMIFERDVIPDRSLIPQTIRNFGGFFRAWKIPIPHDIDKVHLTGLLIEKHHDGYRLYAADMLPIFVNAIDYEENKSMVLIFRNLLLESSRIMKFRQQNLAKRVADLDEAIDSIFHVENYFSSANEFISSLFVLQRKHRNSLQRFFVDRIKVEQPYLDDSYEFVSPRLIELFFKLDLDNYVEDMEMSRLSFLRSGKRFTLGAILIYLEYAATIIVSDIVSYFMNSEKDETKTHAEIDLFMKNSSFSVCGEPYRRDLRHFASLAREFNENIGNIAKNFSKIYVMITNIRDFIFTDFMDEFKEYLEISSDFSRFAMINPDRKRRYSADSFCTICYENATKMNPFLCSRGRNFLCDQCLEKEYCERCFCTCLNKVQNRFGNYSKFICPTCRKSFSVGGLLSF